MGPRDLLVAEAYDLLSRIYAMEDAYMEAGKACATSISILEAHYYQPYDRELGLEYWKLAQVYRETTM